MPTRTDQRSLWQQIKAGGVRTLFFLATALASGCGLGSSGSDGSGYAPSVEEARSMVKVALDAWSARKLNELSRLEPPVRFVDPDQASGLALASYQLADGQERTTGPTVELVVDLSLKGSGGRVRSKKAVYQVSKEPMAAVVRNDPD